MRPPAAAGDTGRDRHAMNDTTLPADGTAALLDLGHRYYLPVYRPRQMVLERGAGSRLWDNQGREYVDWAAGIAVCGLGHNDPDLHAALVEQAG